MSDVIRTTDPKLCPDCDEPSLSKADGILQCHSCGWSEEDYEPGDPDGECFRGREYASALAEQQAQAKRLK
jgi:ribosomal protein L37AE/L43A